ALLTEGNPAAAAAPVLGVALVWAFWRLPVRVTVPAMLFLAVAVDAPQDNPADGLWQSPMFFLGRVLCDNWSRSMGLPGASFSGMDLAVGVLVLKVLTTRRGRGPVIAVAGLRWVLWMFSLALLALAVWGVSQGGSLDAAYWQVRQLALVPAFVFLCSAAVEQP